MKAITGGHYEVLIIGGSYAGLSAAMALGRARRNVLVIDSGKPCNRQTPHSHNFLTQDGATPQEISTIARRQLGQYATVEFYEGTAIKGERVQDEFTVETSAGDVVTGKKILFATGVTDQFPAIKDFAECWGISALHCPYCHGYEVAGKQLGVISNGDMGFEFSKLISQWSDNLVLFTNGASTLTEYQQYTLSSANIQIQQIPIVAFQHRNGYLQEVILADGSRYTLSAIFARVGFTHHCDIPLSLQCELTEQGYLKVDEFQKTSQPGIYAAGDNVTAMRSVSAAVAGGTKAGSVINKDLVDDRFAALAPMR